MTEPAPIFIRPEDDTALDALDAVCTVESAERILVGAYMSVTRAYEKGAKREPFLEILEHCVQLHDLMARIKFLNATRLILAKQVIQPEDLTKSIAILTAQAESRRTKLIEHMKAVKKIPAPGVTKH